MDKGGAGGGGGGGGPYRYMVILYVCMHVSRVAAGIYIYLGGEYILPSYVS